MPLGIDFIRLLYFIYLDLLQNNGVGRKCIHAFTVKIFMIYLEKNL